jgi:hypothetical protein
MTSNLQKNMRENAQKWCQRVVREKGIAGLKSEFASLKKPFDPSTAKVFMEQPPGTRNRYRVSAFFSDYFICLGRSLLGQDTCGVEERRK